MNHIDSLKERQVNTLLAGLERSGTETHIVNNDNHKAEHVCGCNDLSKRLAAMEREIIALKATARLIIEAVVEISDVKQQTGSFYA